MMKKVIFMNVILKIRSVMLMKLDLEGLSFNYLNNIIILLLILIIILLILII